LTAASAPEVAGVPAPRREWMLSSTLISPSRRVAVINGQIVKKGDMLEDAQVLDITPLAVKLKDAQGDFSLQMLPASIKTPHAKPFNRMDKTP